MLHLRSALFLAALPLATGAFAAPSGAPVAPVVLTLGAEAEARPVSPLFAGISMETETILPAADGSHFFSPKNAKLIALFRRLGVRHLRIGGNTVDDKTKAPALADIDELFAFAKAAGLKVTYSVRLKDGDPAESAGIARHIGERYKALSTGITIGNECDQYLEWPAYLESAQAHAKAMRKAAPTMTINGPAIHLDGDWPANFVKAFKDIASLEYIGSHAYFGGGAYDKENGKVVERDPAPLRAEMLSPAWQAKYQELHDKIVPNLNRAGLPFRIDETNTYYNGGAAGASNSMAAAVWALDYLYWWAERGAQGLNFHTGTSLPFVKGKLPGDALRKPCFYAVFWSLPEGGYATKAVGYGLKTFDLGGHGKLFPVQIAAPDRANVTAHAVLADDGGVFVTVINKEIGAAPRRVTLARPKDRPFTRAEAMALRVKGDDAAATEGFALGGAAIATDGAWEGEWTPVEVKDGAIEVTLPATSAAVLHLTR